MTRPERRADYRLGSLYSLVTAALVATQEPFSALAARRFGSSSFVFLTQLALLFSVPLLTLPRSSRRDFIRLMGDSKNLGKLAILFIFGLCGLLLYYVGLSSAHPIITATIFNLSPFWAALVAMVVSRKPIPVSPHVFFGCFVVAFAGAMIVAWSQLDNANGRLVGDIIESMLHSRWSYAIPIPIFFALSGSLVGKWFSDFDELAAIAANFIVSSFILLPSILLISRLRPTLSVDDRTLPAILLLLLGTLAAAAAGRVFYQVALTTTDNDNGFVTMFFLLIPGLSALITIPLSWWIPDLRFVVDRMFYIGLAIVTVSLLLFLWEFWDSPRN